MAEVKIQDIYESALSILGKTEEGTDYPFMDRFPAILNVHIAEINLFRDDNKQIALISKMSDSVDLSDREKNALSYCMAANAAAEIDMQDLALKNIFDMRNRLMASINTGLEDVSERYGV